MAHVLSRLGRPARLMAVTLPLFGCPLKATAPEVAPPYDAAFWQHWSGERREIALLPTLASTRLQHKPLAWMRAVVSRSGSVERIRVPAGEFEVRAVRLEAAQRSVDLLVEVAVPHRVVRAVSSDGTKLELTGSTRAPYWQMNGERFEASVAELGLKPPRSR